MPIPRAKDGSQDDRGGQPPKRAEPTGGADAQQSTAGVQMNFVLKAGTNTPHGSARTYYENKGLQSSNLPDGLVDALGGVSGKGNRLTKYADYGGELGGPIVKDRLWG